MASHRKLLSEELHNLKFSHTVIRINYEVKKHEIGRTCSTRKKEEECKEDDGGKARRKETTPKVKNCMVR
jgi:hypothetical protein